MKKLLKDWEVKGTSFEDFQKEVSELNARTSYHDWYLGELDVLSVEEINVITSKIKAYSLVRREELTGGGEKKVPRIMQSSINIPMNVVDEKDFPQMVDEVEVTRTIFLDEKKNSYFIDNGIVSSLGRYLKVEGFAFTVPSLERNVFLKYLMEKEKEMCLRFVIRQSHGIAKILAVKTTDFAISNLTPLVELANLIRNEHPEYKISQWSLTQTVGTIELINEQNSFLISGVRFTPGLKIKDSSLGESSFHLTGGYFLSNGGFLEVCDYIQIHNTSWNENLVAQTQYKKLPALCANLEHYKETLLALDKKGIRLSIGDTKRMIRSVWKKASMESAIKSRSRFSQVITDAIEHADLNGSLSGACACLFSAFFYMTETEKNYTTVQKKMALLPSLMEDWCLHEQKKREEKQKK